MTEENIVYRNGDYWVLKADKGWYEVYSVAIKSATEKGWIGDDGLKRAIAECDRLAASN